MNIAATKNGKCPACETSHAYVSTTVIPAPDNSTDKILTTMIWCKKNHTTGFGVKLTKEGKTSALTWEDAGRWLK